MRTERVSGTTPTTKPTMAQDHEIRNAIVEHLPTEPHKALARPQVRAMLRAHGYDISNDEAPRYLLALNGEARINRTAEGKYHGFEQVERRTRSQNPERTHQHRDVMKPYRPTEDDAVL